MNNETCKDLNRSKQSKYVFDKNSKQNIWVHIVNIIISLALLALALPLFVLIAILIKLEDGGPVFYKGERMGLRKKIFNIYKFRSLKINSESVIGSNLLSSEHKLETKVGKRLRDTRLDELPQLINVLKGDMNLIGPRPERMAVYNRVCRKIPNYDTRFTVKPGLVGYSQAYTPHGAPKTTRVLIDNYYIKNKKSPADDLKFFFNVIYTLSVQLILRSYRSFKRRLTSKDSFFSKEQRKNRRISHHQAIVMINNTEDNNPDRTVAQLIDINENAMRINLTKPLLSDELDLMLVTGLNRKLRMKKKVTRCRGKVRLVRDRKTTESLTLDHIIDYEPASPLNSFKLQKYFLRQSIL